jgi:hypothetical protein
MNDCVPSIGSMIQRRPLVPLVSPSSSPSTTVGGERGAERAAEALLRAAVGDRDRAAVGLRFHDE